MYYCVKNFKTKKALKEAVAAGVIVEVTPTEPNESEVKDGRVCVGGPHYPEAHKWYAEVVVENGLVVKVK